jgi:DNA repair exonuclease SbcCD ATPase subunit
VGNICFCGKEKREDRLACPRCFELYRKETKGKISLLEWVKKQVLAKLEELGASTERPKTDPEINLMVKKDELWDLEKQVEEETSTRLREQLAGAGRLRQEELDALREDIRKGLWQERGGNRLYAEFKNLQEEIKTKVAPLRAILAEVEKTQKEHSSVDRLIGTIFPSEGKPE